MVFVGACLPGIDGRVFILELSGNIFFLIVIAENL